MVNNIGVFPLKLQNKKQIFMLKKGKNYGTLFIILSKKNLVYCNNKTLGLWTKVIFVALR